MPRTRTARSVVSLLLAVSAAVGVVNPARGCACPARTGPRSPAPAPVGTTATPEISAAQTPKACCDRPCCAANRAAASGCCCGPAARDQLPAASPWHLPAGGGEPGCGPPGCDCDTAGLPPATPAPAPSAPAFGDDGGPSLIPASPAPVPQSSGRVRLLSTTPAGPPADLVISLSRLTC